MMSAVEIDILNGLLEAELTCIFRFLEEGSAYLNRASADLRGPLKDMVLSNHRRTRTLIGLIESLGGRPVSGRMRPDEQFMAYLNVRFLLPKLIEESKLLSERYDNALRILEEQASSRPVLQRHLEELNEQLQALEAFSRG